MKKPLSFSLFLFLLTFSLTFSNQSSAQDPVGGGAAGFESVDGSGVITFETLYFDFDLPETPAPDALDYIIDVMLEAGANPLNIVFSKEAEEIRLPSMELRQITFSQFVSFINRIGGAKRAGAVTSDPFAGGGGPPVFPPHSGPRFGISEEDGIWYFWAEKTEPNEGAPVAAGGMGMDGGKVEAKPALETMVYALDGETEIVLGLIEEALAETRRHLERPEPSLKFHEPSSTLIVSATLGDLQMIEEVIQVMANRAEQEMLQEQHSERRRLTEENQLLRERLSELENAASARRDVARAAEVKVKHLQAELAVAQDSYNDEHPVIQNLKKQLARALEELKNAE